MLCVLVQPLNLERISAGENRFDAFARIPFSFRKLSDGTASEEAAEKTCRISAARYGGNKIDLAQSTLLCKCLKDPEAERRGRHAATGQSQPNGARWKPVRISS